MASATSDDTSRQDRDNAYASHECMYTPAAYCRLSFLCMLMADMGAAWPESILKVYTPAESTTGEVGRSSRDSGGRGGDEAVLAGGEGYGYGSGCGLRAMG